MQEMKHCQYFVEGEDEEKLVYELISEMQLIVPGRVKVFNVTLEKLTKLRLMSLQMGTIVVLVFDTDAGNLSVLRDNMELLKQAENISDVICVTQVKNLEDELVRACNIKDVKELLGAVSMKDFKRRLLKEKNLSKKLREHGFDIGKFWSKQDDHVYAGVRNDASRIKLD